MNSTSTTYLQNSTRTIVESWFIPIDIFRIICNILAIVLSTIFLFIIILDKTCHTVSMMLTANSCLVSLIFGCSMISFSIFTFENDLKQIEYQDLLCIFRTYIAYVAYALLNYSFLLQSIHRYVLVVYPNRLFWQSKESQALLISITWIFALLYPIPSIFTGGVIYVSEDQVCITPLGVTFSTIYIALCIYTIPILSIIFIYFKLLQYVHQMRKRIIAANTLSRAERELKMVRHIVILVIILLTVCFPYEVFVFMSFFTKLPKYHFRIAFIFVDLSLVFVIIALFQFTDPLETSLMKRIKWRTNVVITPVA